MLKGVVSVSNTGTGLTVICTQCPICGEINSVTVDTYSYERFLTCEHSIQSVFPELREEEQELLMTGICSECYEKMFSTDDIHDLIEEQLEQH